MHPSWLLVFFFISGYGAVPLLMSVTRKIKLIEDTDTTNETLLASTAHHVIALDYHLARGEIYFTEATGQIYRSWLKSDDRVGNPTIIAEVKLSDGIAVDWIHDNLYWTDVGRKTLEVATLDGLYRKVLLNATHGLQSPRAIIVDPSKGMLFWSDWGINARVESSGLDGKNVKKVVSSNVQWPNGLTLDLSHSKLYIVDGFVSTISSCNYDGSDLKVLSRSSDNILQAFGLTFYSNTLYWNSWRARSLFKMNTGNLQTEALLRQTGFQGLSERMMGLKAVHTSVQPQSSTQDPCKTADCSHRCLLSQDLMPTCFCPFGFKLSPDGKTCTEEGYLILSWRRTIRRYTMDGYEDESLIDSTKAAISISYHLKKGIVFWSDIEEHRIYRAPLEQLNNKTVVASPETCDGLAVDWIHDVLYWTDTDRNTLEAAQLDGSKHMIIFNTSLDQPRDIALDPLEGLMFWSDWGVTPKIERSTLDGLERKIIIGDDHIWPNGLTIDIPLKKIYYVDGKMGIIYSSSYDGTDKKIVFLPPPTTPLHLFAITLLKDELFWTDWQTRTLYRSPKDEITVARGVASSSIILLRPNGIKAVHSSLQETKENPCAKVHCQNLCLGTKHHNAHCMEEETPDIDVSLEDVPLACHNQNLLCDGKEDCPDGSDEGVKHCAAIENLVVYKKSKSEAYFRVKVTNGTKNQLQKFVGSYSSVKSDLTEQFERTAEPCVMWPESYCFHLFSLQPNTVYDFKISAALKGGKVGNKFTVSAITKEEVSGPPVNVQIFKYNATSLLYQWHHPNQSNGIIKSFIINIDETETFEEEKCCQPFPIIEVPVTAEEPFYDTASTGLTPASSYAISIAAKNSYVGSSAVITVNTPPPPMEVIRMPRVEVASLLPLSWHPQEELGEWPQYHNLIRSYMLLLLPPKNEPLNEASTNEPDAIKELLQSKFGDRFLVLWNKKVEEMAALQSPIKVESLSARKQYKLAWVQVAQYKDSYSIDFLESDPFMAI